MLQFSELGEVLEASAGLWALVRVRLDENTLRASWGLHIAVLLCAVDKLATGGEMFS
jgi:hypothetical protein